MSGFQVKVYSHKCFYLEGGSLDGHSRPRPRCWPWPQLSCPQEAVCGAALGTGQLWPGFLPLRACEGTVSGSPAALGLRGTPLRPTSCPLECFPAVFNDAFAKAPFETRAVKLKTLGTMAPQSLGPNCESSVWPLSGEQEVTGSCALSGVSCKEHDLWGQHLVSS